MTNETPQADHVTTNEPIRTSTNPFTLANAKKAYTAGVAGAITAAGGLSISTLFAGNGFDANQLAVDASVVVGGFVIAFFGAWLPAQPK